MTGLKYVTGMQVRPSVVGLLLTVACGRTELGARDAVVSATDASMQSPGLRDAGSTDAGATDAGVVDGGVLPVCPPDPTVGRIAGTTPLGPIDFPFVWIGSESPGSHACAHFSVQARATGSLADPSQLTVDFHAGPPIPGLNARGWGTLSMRGLTVETQFVGNISRADGLTLPAVPRELWRTTLTLSAVDGGWSVSGSVQDAPDCPEATWMCL